MAFEQAIAELTADERNMLRLHFLDGLTVRELGRLYDTTASTVSRWMKQARTKIVDATRRLLGERLALSASEAR